MLLRAVASAAILAYLMSRIDLGEAGRALLESNPLFLGATLLLVAVDRIVMILRWILLLRAAEAPVSVASAGRIYLVSSFVGSFLPAGVGGDAARAYSLARQTAQASEAVASVAIDRVLGMMSIVLLGTIGLAVWTRQTDVPARDAMLTLAALTASACAAFFWADTLVRRSLPASWHRSRPVRRLLELVGAVGRYRRRGWAMVVVFVLSIGVQLLRVAQAYLLGSGLGLSVPFAYYLVFMPVGLLLLLLPVSVSGFGLPQGVIVWLLRPVGVADPVSFALSTLIVLTGLAGNLPGAWLYVRARRA